MTCKTQKALNALGECVGPAGPGAMRPPGPCSLRGISGFLQKNDRKVETRAATSGGQSGQSGDDITKWDETHASALTARRAASAQRFVEENPKWRHKKQHGSRPALRLGVNGWKRVRPSFGARPADADGYVSTLHYSRFVGACLAFQFSGEQDVRWHPALTIGSWPSSCGAIAGAGDGIRRQVAATQERRWVQSRGAVARALQLGARRRRNDGALLENDRLSGLRSQGKSWFLGRWGHHGGDLDWRRTASFSCGTAARIFQIAPHWLSSFIGCDTGNLAKQE